MCLRLPSAPHSIQKGTPLKHVLGEEAVDCLAHNVVQAYPAFNAGHFRAQALAGLEPLGIMERGHKLAQDLWQHLPPHFGQAWAVLQRSLTPIHTETEDLGLAVFFYLPHTLWVARYGLDAAYNGGQDPFATAMQAQYELTQRFTAEFSIRPFLQQEPQRTLAQLALWIHDPSPHVRRLCSEGSRPRLPWGMRLQALVRDPSPTLPLLEALKDDPSLYVRRSVANHLGDIAKDHPELLFALCERWLADSNPERRWLLRHALRYHAKKGDPKALALRAAAKG